MCSSCPAKAGHPVSTKVAIEAPREASNVDVYWIARLRGR
jgi:hypothetical protein